MDANQATAELLEAGKSGELSAAFQCVAEATTLQGEPRYGPRVCRHLGRLIVCRTYAGTVLQLCHLIVAADACGQGRGRYENFFFGCEPASPPAFIGHIDATLAAGGWRRPGFERGENGITVPYKDGVFTVEFGRMPVLAALFEFLITTLSYTEIAATIATMLERPESQEAVRAAANGIEGMLYHYLNQHLPSVHNQTKFNLILDFFKRRTATGSIAIDDATILEFWQENAGDGSDRGDFRLFRTVSDAFVNFRRALRAADEKAAVEASLPLGSDRETAEFDPKLLLELAEKGDDWRSPLEVLADEPASRIKFLNRQESDTLTTLMEYGPAALSLPLSLLRHEVFGRSQQRITQALRKKRKDTVPALISCQDTSDYGAWTETLSGLREHLQQVIKASLHVALGQSASDDAVIIAPPANDYEHPSETPSDKAAIADVLAEAKQAFRSFSRQGFDENNLGDEDIIAGFEAGSAALVATREQIDVFLAALHKIESTESDLGHWFQHDRKVFAGQFARLYGEPS
ncbi:MAG: hypothetical protein QF797_06285 [Alphaproteobacteria bacterium]|jgi:hypothetical protein|nr:hypothetical protein [Alphaproteobacteria bacterium]MDP6622127.1 hypothetical protein [Alphaproteobacteria bacterium]|tara:strand:+ start:130 stop:1689 length:1560 start_codon:yes stop_codon:yes gene_type:complete